MSFLKSWFADRSSASGSAQGQVPAPDAILAPDAIISPESVPIDLPALLEALRVALVELDAGTLDPDVVRAKLADVCRGLSIAPLDPLEFDSIAAGLDPGGWERMGLLVLVG